MRFAAGGLSVIITALVLLTGCVNNPTEPAVTGPPPDQAALDLLAQRRYEEAAAVYLQLAQEYKAPLKQDYQLRAADALIDAQDFIQAKAIAQSLSEKGLTAEHNAFRRIVLGRIALVQNDPDLALGFLQSNEDLGANPSLLARFHLLRAQAMEQTGQTLSAARERANADPLLGPTAADTNRRRLWLDLADTSIDDLQNALGTQNVTFNGWLDLAIVAKRFITDAVIFERAVTDWNIRYPDHPASVLIVPELVAASLIDTTPPSHIALLLPLEGTFGKAATAVRDGFLAAWFEDSGNPDRPKITVLNSAERDIAAVYAEAVESGADFVVGPLDKPSVTALVKAAPLPVSTLALNHADETTALIEETIDPQASESTETVVEETHVEAETAIASGVLYQFALSPEEEARRVAERAWFEGFGNAALVAPEGNWGFRVGDAFTEAWTELGGIVVDHKNYESSAPDMSPPIAALLGVDESKQRYRELRQTLGLDLKHETRRRRDVDFVFMAAFPRQARQLRPQLRFHRAADLPVFATSHVFSGVADPAADADIDGVWFGDMPWVLHEGGAHGRLRHQTAEVWSGVFNRYARLYAFGIDAYAIVPELGRLRAQPENELAGETGWLSVGEDSKVRRRLEWARFAEGLPELLDAEPTEEE